jgi:hypothetical protein
MFGSIALDVFIGMVLIYLLYSLLITIIGEMLATWMGIRARLLRKAIEKMLNDDLGKAENLTRIQKQAGQFFLYEFNSFRNSFAGKFYNHPSIKYLSQSAKKSISFKNSKPSYISRENFTDTMVQLFRNKGTGADDVDKINFCLKFNTLHIQPQTLAHIRNLLNDSGNDLAKFREKLMKWFDDTMDRTNGWYKRKLQLILFWLGFVLAVSFNVDSIKMAKQLSQDKEARNQLVQLGINEAKEGSLADSIVKNSKDTATIKSDTLLRKSFNEVYKATENANKVLGLGWQFETLRKNTTISRTFYTHTFAYINTEIMDPLRRLYSLRKQCSILADAPKKQAQKKFYLEKIKEINTSIDGYLWRLNFISKTKFTAFDSLNCSVDTIKKTTTACFYGKKNYGPVNKVGYIVGASMPWRMRFWGFVITALMLSLGAPFWFDLLKKLVALRGAGVKPEEKKENPARLVPLQDQVGQQARTETAATPEKDILDEALDAFTEIIKNERGIVAIALEPLKKLSKSGIKVHVENNRLIPYLVSKYGKSQALRSGETIPVSYSESTPIAALKGDCGGEIANKKETLGHGTLCCFLQDREGQKYFLSCWHVLKDNYNWNESIREKEIVGTGQTTIGFVEEGCLTDNLDIGIACCNENNSLSNKALPITAQHRTVTPYDALINTDVIVVGKVTGRKNAKIFHHKVNAVLEYPGEMSKRIIYDTFSVALIDEQGNTKSLTLPGDSGAMVMTNENGRHVPLGMIIGGNENFSYAIKFSNAFNADKLYHNYSFILT